MEGLKENLFNVLMKPKCCFILKLGVACGGKSSNEFKIFVMQISLTKYGRLTNIIGNNLFSCQIFSLISNGKRNRSLIDVSITKKF